MQLTVTLDRGGPKVWRQVQLPATSTLAELHELLVGAFERLDDHLHEFTTVDAAGRSTCYTDHPEEHGEDDRETSLATVLARAVELVYIYDLGAGWTHIVELDGVVSRSTDGPRLLAGKGQAPDDEPLEEDY